MAMRSGRMLRVFALLWLALLSGFGCAAGSPGPAFAPGQVVTPGGDPVGENEIAARMARADYILIGESHDRALDHQAQARLLALAARSGLKPLLGLEMLPHSRYENELARFTAGALSVRDLPGAVDWRDNWGFDFALYRPVFEAASEAGIPVRGLNLDNATRRAVSRNGLTGLDARGKKALPSAVALPLPEQRALLADFFLEHSAMIAGAKAGEKAQTGESPQTDKIAPRPRARGSSPVLPVTVRGTKNGAPAPVDIPLSLRAPFERFLLIQSLWDATMAERAFLFRGDYGHTRPVVILAGGGHVAAGHGIAYRLSLLDPGARILAIMPFSGRQPRAGQAGLFYYSPETRSAMPAAAQKTASPRGYGLAFAREGRQVRIKAVSPGSRAERAGLLPGDVLLKAGDMPLADLQSLHAAARGAARQGRALSLTVLRKNREFETKLE
jgi:uncharacterized iron-regulated protein